jgi:diguanylate cyclase (GGDEF)-like protein
VAAKRAQIGPESASPESASPESASPESASPESASPESASPESGVRSTVAALRAELAALRHACDHYRRRMAVDPVTGLYARHHFDERLEHEWRRALHFWTPLSLIAIDAGEISTLRDHGGRHRVDRALAQVARVIDDQRRDVDIACRVGPSSFAVILPGTGRLGAEAELERLATCAEREDLFAKTSLTLGFGLAVAFDDAQTPLELLIAADEAALRARCPDERHATIPIAPPSWRPAA